MMRGPSIKLSASDSDFCAADFQTLIYYERRGIMKFCFCLSWTIALLGGLLSPQAGIAQEPTNDDLYKKAQALAQAGKLAEAEEPLNRVLAQANDHVAQLLLFRADLRAKTGRFQEAATDLEQVIQINPSNHWPWFTVAPLLVQTGETVKYRTCCKEMLSRFNGTGDAPIANRVAKSCLLMPSALDAEDTVLAENLADKSVALTTDGGFWPWRSMTKALAEFRRGKFTHASVMIDLFLEQMSEAERSGALSGGWDTCEADSYFISAMTHSQLKEMEKARAALEKGRVIVRTKLPDLRGKDLGAAWWDVLMAYILMSEASTTVGPSTPAQP
jgi:tetratricopeptide (TPR) repeat protein